MTGKKYPYIIGVPLTIAGVQVGSARMNADGTIDLLMDSPNALGREILEALQTGHVSGLEIKPTILPAIPASATVITPAHAEIRLLAQGVFKRESHHNTATNF
jgi:hypothetical protein